MAVSACPVGSIGCTRHANSSINVVAAAATSGSFAGVLSHELTHCRLHDKALAMAVSSGCTPTARPVWKWGYVGSGPAQLSLTILID